MKSIEELLEYVSKASVNRNKKSVLNLVILAFFGGMFIALGAVANILVSSDLYYSNTGLAKFLGASVFPVGLMAIVLLKFELFTSNCMMSLAVVNKKLKIRKMLKILSIVWIFNLIGALFIAYITHKTHTFSESSVKLLEDLATHKMHTGAYDLILKGILCNILVCMASLLGYMFKDGISKIFAIWFPIMLFILLGYSHVVANMLYLPLAYMYSMQAITLPGILYNFFFVTIGNFIGGGIILILGIWQANKE